MPFLWLVWESFDNFRRLANASRFKQFLPCSSKSWQYFHRFLGLKDGEGEAHPSGTAA
jgi:hypothetical protein